MRAEPPSAVTMCRPLPDEHHVPSGTLFDRVGQVGLAWLDHVPFLCGCLLGATSCTAMAGDGCGPVSYNHKLWSGVASYLFQHHQRWLFFGGLQVLTGPWQEQQVPAVQSGCDMSNCSYCQGLARMRRDASGKAGCWLRRKRSRIDLAAMDAAEAQRAPGAGGDDPVQLAVVPDVGPNKQPRVASMWDHALAEPNLVDSALGSLAVRVHSEVPVGLLGAAAAGAAARPLCNSARGPAK
jgi:hypothetical protein